MLLESVRQSSMALVQVLLLHVPDLRHDVGVVLFSGVLPQRPPLNEGVDELGGGLSRFAPLQFDGLSEFVGIACIECNTTANWCIMVMRHM